MTNWDKRWLNIAKEVASWSKDPRRKVGCVLVNLENTQLSGGFNGFPRGVADDARLDDKLKKLLMVVHAEANAIAAAARNGHSLLGAIAYITSNPCAQCASLMIQAGIMRVVYIPTENQPEWQLSHDLAMEMFAEVGVRVVPLRF